MIISQLSGGLGNQLFQWAFAYNLGTVFNLLVYFDQSFYKSQYKRQQQLASIPSLNNLEFVNNYSQIPDIPTKIFTIEEQFGNLLNTNELILNKDDAYYLIGYWQSPYYFKSVCDSVISTLKPIDNIAQKLIRNHNLNDNLTVSMHIRRTDYLSSDGFHIVQPIQYYEEAISKINEYDQLLIFSDDIEWCFKNLKFNKQCIITDSYTDIENIWLMSLCDHNIIANSSFSWWGAYLNTNDNRRVIAPKKWYGNIDSSTWQSIYDRSWFVI